MRTQTPTKRVYLLDTNEVDNFALDGTTSVSCLVATTKFSLNKIYLGKNKNTCRILRVTYDKVPGMFFQKN
eukprot:SAG11_NODE_28344_length_322_cov_3.695067_1_plen_70_part_10